MMPEQNPSLRISVVMCTYRGTAHLAEQLDSILRQTRQPAELIVCDDNSGDGTVAILEQFREKAGFPVHVIVNAENLGSTPNFDQALERANGDLIALCDQDDFWFPEKLSRMGAILELDPTLGGVFSDATLIDDRGAPARGSEHNQSAQTLWQLHGFDRSKQEQFKRGGAIDLLLQRDIVTGATLMVRAGLRSCWHPIPASWIHDGWITWMLVLQSRIVPVQETLIGYRLHAQQQLGIGGSSRAERLKQIRDTERKRYARVSNQFEDLRLRVQELSPSNIKLLKALKEKVLFLRQRSLMPRNLVLRVCWILAHLRHYQRYARGWRSLRKDLFLS
ncbi:glycosyltransferase [Granulicella mallensis]|uniref:Glycosyl transferase family 2 n=1 Tax=Granulicella mallensis (strain ATCC BAA-1857 / DSM 23137 / MP5ACTX8) TaxID=682795 RepID=G8NZN1_GRAMM|nr:glycosyltransferase [Granulicella mallensis]AEU39151.1 glycosyl transferase family 2 [Granulicella mallensis MP5ACTX8]